MQPWSWEKPGKKYSNGSIIEFNLGELLVGVNNPPAPGLFWLRQFQHNPPICSIMIKKQANLAAISFPEDIFYGEDIAQTVKIGLENQVAYLDSFVSTYNRFDKSGVYRVNEQFSQTERYFQFYRKFALPFFFERRGREPFAQAYNLCEEIAYNMLMRLIRVEAKPIYQKVLKEMQKNSLISNSIIRCVLFNVLPFKYAGYSHQMINLYKKKWN